MFDGCLMFPLRIRRFLLLSGAGGRGFIASFWDSSAARGDRRLRLPWGALAKPVVRAKNKFFKERREK
jgi:hypothetical protein